MTDSSTSPNAEGDPFPGWYPDPLDGGLERFWDGRDWTSNARKAVPEADSEVSDLSPKADLAIDRRVALTESDPPIGAGASGSATTPDSRQEDPPSITARAVDAVAGAGTTKRPRIFGDPVSTSPTNGSTASLPQVSGQTGSPTTGSPTTGSPTAGQAQIELSHEQPDRTVDPSAVDSRTSRLRADGTKSIFAHSANGDRLDPSGPEPITDGNPATTSASHPTEHAAGGKTNELAPSLGWSEATTAGATAPKSDHDRKPPAKDRAMRVALAERSGESESGSHGRVDRRALEVEEKSSKQGVLVGAAALLALLIGLGVGWVIGQSTTDESATNTTVATTLGEEDGIRGDDGDAADDAVENDGGDPAASTVDPQEVTDLQEQAERLETQLAAAEEDLQDREAMIAELETELTDEQAHNDLLQTWFTSQVRDRSERDWSNEVERACQADEVPTTDNTRYIRSMELIGTHAQLVAAVVECRGEAS